MVNTIFIYDVERMEMDEGLVTSAILRRKRGYDKSFHSAFVAVTMANFYNQLGMLVKANSLTTPMAELCKRIKNKTAIFDRSWKPYSTNNELSNWSPLIYDDKMLTFLSSDYVLRKCHHL